MTDTMTERLEVIDLGESGETWIVRGTFDTATARDAITDHLVLVGIAGDTDEARDLLAHVVTLPRRDWFFRKHKDGGDVLCVGNTGKPWGSASKVERQGLTDQRTDDFVGVFVS
ncbi:hypothetical protein NYO98_10545 [Nocardioides sp. STR2]|uniref:Uncharacterized protein n=1 Tax=Nocardioides pini TaxID=2975053 RepID=A0ABT4CFT6_9ACTN|nr:hypothetical protein [Nocardioides pini]MCY4726717.1 hypothetical protein [Nocardioides pini]